jgi:hypothetical protein
VRRRNLIPLAILAVLAVLTAVFAVVGATAAPSAETVTVQNASARTFGTPTGSVPFVAALTNTLASGPNGRTQSQERVLRYTPPDRMAVLQLTNAGLQPLGVLPPQGASCILSAFSSIVGGTTPWAAKGDGTYTRTETLADYSARVPTGGTTTCQPQPAAVHGQVSERALVRSGYLIDVRLTVVVPPQSLSNGRPAAAGVEGEQLAMSEIGNTRVRTLAS